MKQSSLLGRTIVDVREMTSKEMDAEGWEETPRHYAPVVIVLDNGDTFYASRDEEGNGPGAMFGTQGDTAIMILPPV